MYLFINIFSTFEFFISFSWTAIYCNLSFNWSLLLKFLAVRERDCLICSFERIEICYRALTECVDVECRLWRCFITTCTCACHRTHFAVSIDACVCLDICVYREMVDIRETHSIIYYLPQTSKLKRTGHWHICGDNIKRTYSGRKQISLKTVFRASSSAFCKARDRYCLNWTPEQSIANFIRSNLLFFKFFIQIK